VPGTTIKTRLQEHHLSNAWLISELRKRNIDTDSVELSKALSGTRTGPKIDEILINVHDILSEYEKKYLGTKE